MFIIFACIGKCDVAYESSSLSYFLGIYLFKFNRDIYNQDDFRNGGPQYPECDQTMGCVDLSEIPFWVWTSFASFEQALITLFVLLTTENFPEVCDSVMLPMKQNNVFNFLRLDILRTWSTQPTRRTSLDSGYWVRHSCYSFCSRWFSTSTRCQIKPASCK